MLVIKEVKTKKEIRDFINFPNKLYKGNQYFVPMITLGERDIFKASHPYNKVCDVVFYNAYLDNEIVGRIQGIIQTTANEKWNQKRVRFTRFDSIDNQEVANGLFDAVTKWAKDKGMEEFVGPLGYSDLEREGLLVEGFEELQTYEEQYNFSYYQKLIENYGFEKDVDWLEHKLYPPKTKNDRLVELGKKMLDRYHLRLVQTKTVREFIKKYSKDFFEMIDKTYSHLYGTMPLNDEIVASLVGDFKLLVRAKDIMIVLDENDKMVGFALMFPSISEAVRKSRGRLTPLFLFRFFRAKRNPKVFDLGLIGISPEYVSKGIATCIIGLLIDFLDSSDVDHLETNLILEDNSHMLNLLKRFDSECNKRRRCYKLNIK